jgi:hypothetical protein
VKTDGTKWEVIATTTLGSNDQFSFGETPVPTGNISYYVVAMVETISTTTGASTIAIKGNNKVAGTATAPSAVTSDTTYSVTATGNGN